MHACVHDSMLLVCMHALVRVKFICSLFFNSYYLWSISQPGKTGTPNFDLSKDPDASIVNYTRFTSVQLAHERVISKVFNHYAIPLEITDAIQSSFKAKLWCMGKRYTARWQACNMSSNCRTGTLSRTN